MENKERTMTREKGKSKRRKTISIGIILLLAASAAGTPALAGPSQNGTKDPIPFDFETEAFCKTEFSRASVFWGDSTDPYRQHADFQQSPKDLAKNRIRLIKMVKDR